MRKILFFIPLFLWTCGGGGGGSSPTEPTQPILPNVENITFTTAEDTPKTFTFTGSDPQNQALTYGISSEPENGTVVLSGGAATYTPNTNYHGTDIFYYIASSINGNSNIGTIIATITPVDDEPSTMDVTVTTDEDNAVTMTLEAEEVDGQTIQFNVTGNPSNGSVTISGTTATYTPNQDWFGTDTFNFEAVDVTSKSILNNATATITVNPINDAPLVNDISAQVNLGASVDINLDGSDVEGDNLTYSIVDNPANGSVTIGGSVATYTPDSGPTADYSFTYKANDGTIDSNIATITTAVDADPKIQIHPLSGAKTENEEHNWLYDVNIPLKWNTLGVEKVNIYLHRQDNQALVKTIAINVPVADGENEKVINLNVNEIKDAGGVSTMYFLITDASNETIQSDPNISGNAFFNSASWQFDSDTSLCGGQCHNPIGESVEMSISSNLYILDYYYGEEKPIEIYLYRRGEMLTKIGELSYTWNEWQQLVTETLQFTVPTEFGRGAHYDFVAVEQHTGKTLSIADYLFNDELTFVDDNQNNGMEFFTLSFWFKFENQQGEREGIYYQDSRSGWQDNSSDTFTIKRDGNNAFVINLSLDEVGTITSDAFTSSSDWNFFALTISDVQDSIKVRVNNSTQRIANVNDSLRMLFQRGKSDEDCSQCYAGSQFFGQHDSETGYYDNYAMWGRFMSDTELDNLYNNGRNHDLSSTNDLELYFPMNNDFKNTNIYNYDQGSSEQISMDYIEGLSINKIPLQIRVNSGTYEDEFNKLSFEDGALKVSGHARFHANLDFLN